MDFMIFMARFIVKDVEIAVGKIKEYFITD